MLEEIMQKLEDHAKDCEKLSNYCIKMHNFCKMDPILLLFGRKEKGRIRGGKKKK